MENILKRKDFARWQAGENLSDAALCKAAKEMEGGLIDADKRHCNLPAKRFWNCLPTSCCRPCRQAF